MAIERRAFTRLFRRHVNLWNVIDEFEPPATKRHQESFWEHCLWTSQKMNELCLNDNSMDKCEPVLFDLNIYQWIGLLHDIGKPFTARVNKNKCNKYTCHASIGSNLIELLMKDKLCKADLHLLLFCIDNHMCDDVNNPRVALKCFAREKGLFLRCLQHLKVADMLGRIMLKDAPEPDLIAEISPPETFTRKTIIVILLGLHGSGQSLAVDKLNESFPELCISLRNDDHLKHTCWSRKIRQCLRENDCASIFIIESQQPFWQTIDLSREQYYTVGLTLFPPDQLKNYSLNVRQKLPNANLSLPTHQIENKNGKLDFCTGNIETLKILLNNLLQLPFKTLNKKFPNIKDISCVLSLSEYQRFVITPKYNGEHITITFLNQFDAKYYSFNNEIHLTEGVYKIDDFYCFIGTKDTLHCSNAEKKLKLKFLNVEEFLSNLKPDKSQTVYHYIVNSKMHYLGCSLKNGNFIIGNQIAMVNCFEDLQLAIQELPQSTCILYCYKTNGEFCVYKLLNTYDCQISCAKEKYQFDDSVFDILKCLEYKCNRPAIDLDKLTRTLSIRPN